MLRGVTKFTCDDCGHKFVGPDMEWLGTVYTAPVRCPKCGCKHTYPRSLFGLNRMEYVKIWLSMDER